MISIIIDRVQVQELFGGTGKSDLQEVLKQYIRNIKNVDVLMQIMILTTKIIELSDHKYGLGVINCIEENLLHYEGPVGEKAYEIV